MFESAESYEPLLYLQHEHLTSHVVDAYVTGRSDFDELVEIQDHVSVCDHCAALIQEVGKARALISTTGR